MKIGFSITRFTFMAGLAVMGCAAYAQVNFHVNQATGDDRWSGLLASPNETNTDGPKRTLEGARDAVRKVRNGRSPGGIVSAAQLNTLRRNVRVMTIQVNVAAGTYNLRNGLELDQRDFGNSTRNPLFFKAQAPGSTILEMGHELEGYSTKNSAWWQAYETRIDPSVRPMVFVADLGSLTSSDLGDYKPRLSSWNAAWENASWPRTPANISDFSELVVNGKVQRVAQWPRFEDTIPTANPFVFQRKDGYAFMTGRGPNDTSATASTNTWQSWIIEFRTNLSGLKTPPAAFAQGDIFMRGMLSQSRFAEAWERITSVDISGGATQALVRLDPNNPIGFNNGARRVRYESSEPGRLQIVNSIYELDEPGEYYIDRQNSRVLFYPPADFDPSQKVYLTQGTKPGLNLTNSRYVTFSGFTLQNGRTIGVRLQNTEFCQVDQNTIRNFGFAGVFSEGSRGLQIRNNVVSNIGETAIHVASGNRSLLSSGGNLVDNNFIEGFARNIKFYRPGILLEGMGNTASRNTITNSPGQAIVFRGNDHVMTKNVISNVCQESGDDGAIVTGHDSTQAGNRITENLFSKVYHLNYGQWPVACIFLDGFPGGVTIEQNIFAGVDYAVNAHPTFDLNIRNNVMLNVISRALHIPNSQMSLDAGYHQIHSRVPWQSTAWKTKYPNMVPYLTGNLNGNYRAFAERNVSVGQQEVIAGFNIHSFTTGRAGENIRFDSSPFTTAATGEMVLPAGMIVGFKAVNPKAAGSTLAIAQATNNSARP